MAAGDANYAAVFGRGIGDRDQDAQQAGPVGLINQGVRTLVPGDLLNDFAPIQDSGEEGSQRCSDEDTDSNEIIGVEDLKVN